MQSDHYLTIQTWNPNFDVDKVSFSTLFVRIGLLKLPMNCYNKDFLSNIGKRVVKVLRIDNTTFHTNRGRFLRINVKININQTLKSKFRYRHQIHHIKYEGLHSIYFHYGHHGNIKDDCLDITCTTNSNSSKGDESMASGTTEPLIKKT